MAFAARLSSIPVSKVELTISCKGLLNKDLTSKSDPCAILYMQDKGKWYEFGRTENVKNSLDPNFAKSFELDYYFEEVQNVRVAIYDLDNSTESLADDDFLGQVECTLGQIVSQPSFNKGLILLNGKPAGKGKLTINSNEVSKMNDILHLTFRAQGLDKKDFLGKSDPYLEFSRQAPDGRWQVVHRTEVIKNDLSPKWKPFQVKAQKLCAGDYERQIKGSVFDYDANDDPDLIGEFSFTVPQCIEASQQQPTAPPGGAKQIEFQCINPKKKEKKKGYTNSGMVFLQSCKVTHEFSFLDFIYGGLQINFTVGIDFTASNGDPRSPGTLHYLNPYQPNEYQKATRAVGAVVQDYDSDQMFPALGFGSRIPPDMGVSHCFALNFNPSSPFCAGIEGILTAYQACVPRIQFYGPTNFAPIIQHVAQFASAARPEEGAKNYYVLLMLTDGAISDMSATLSAIVHASTLPMSIIIVGVGGADFTAMNMLDGDDGVLKDQSGHKVVRDIVQFVPFREFQNSPPAELAKHVLAEVPNQVVEYYKKMGIEPRPVPK